MAHDRSLAQQIGWLVQVQRVKLDLNQTKLAARAGISQQALSRLERGAIEPTTKLIERVFTALDLQLRVDVEPLGADLDDEVRRYRDQPEEERADEVGSLFGRRLDELVDVPHMLSGRLAAYVQGAPVAARRLDLVVARTHLDKCIPWLERAGALRWSESWQDFGYDPIDPREPGPLRWMLLGVVPTRCEPTFA
jgi:transcriptional regulator with XRE-family HTH domain